LMLRKVALTLLVLAFSLPCLAGTNLKIGNPPPPFELPNLKNQVVSVDQFLGKEVTILSFFTSWSKSCQEEINFLKALWEQEKGKKLNILGISFDRKTNDLSTFLAQNQIGFDILHDKKLVTLKDYRIIIIPTLFVIDKNGKILNIYVDFDENVKAAIQRDIHQLLSPTNKPS